VTDARRVEAALKSWNEALEAKVAERTAVAQQRALQLQMLASELSQAEQRERRRLAKILHDHLQQLLVAARMRLSMIRRRVHEEKVTATLQQIHDLLDECLTESRSLTMELSPPILYEAGLAAGLEWLARQMDEKHHLRVEVTADPEAEPPCEGKRVFLFEAARELLLNTVKYAQTDSAYVDLKTLDNNWLQLVVQDRGQGFDPASLESRRDSSGFGLFSIRERLEVLGGRLEIDTAPGRGTRVVIEVPTVAIDTRPTMETTIEQATVTSSLETNGGTGETPKSVRTERTRVVLADDHAIVRQGLAGMLRDHDKIEVVGEAADGEQAVELAKQTRPDVVLMDITMPRLNGIEATRHILDALPDIRVIGLSMHHEADMATAMHKAGAVAYFSKDVPADDLFTAILTPHVQP
jgi:CheY-like chemotaxis protein